MLVCTKLRWLNNDILIAGFDIHIGNYRKMRRIMPRVFLGNNTPNNDKEMNISVEVPRHRTYTSQEAHDIVSYCEEIILSVQSSIVLDVEWKIGKVDVEIYQ